MYARPFIDSLDFARNGKHLNGDVPIADLPRLLDALETPQGVLHYTVQGGVDKQGMQFLDLGVVGLCRLRCQRCLDGLDYPIRLDTRLLLLDQPGLDALDDEAVNEEAGFDSILADTHLNVLDMLEEEILLSLPIAPKHELGACQATDGKNTRLDEQNPFAVLAKLKRN
ncbi:MAG TPA: YceD family protein [Gallionella sp.]|nr:YceD family protein [Gallionella sp.]